MAERGRAQEHPALAIPAIPAPPRTGGWPACAVCVCDPVPAVVRYEAGCRGRSGEVLVLMWG